MSVAGDALGHAHPRLPHRSAQIICRRELAKALQTAQDRRM